MFFPSQLILMNWGSGNMNGRQNYILVIEVECSCGITDFQPSCCGNIGPPRSLIRSHRNFNNRKDYFGKRRSNLQYYATLINKIQVTL